MQRYLIPPSFFSIFSVIFLLSISTSSQAFLHHPPRNYKGEILPIVAPCQPERGLRDGIYLGLGGGYDVYRIKQEINVTDSSGEVDQANPAINTRGFVGSVFGGYGQYFDWFYIAGEILFDYSGANSSFSIDNYYTNLAVRSSYGGAILPGIRINENSLFYARLGYLRSFFRIKESGTLGSNETSSWEGGFNAGLGIETALYEGLSMRIEYSYTTYGSFASNLFDTKFNPSNNQFMLGFLYRFECI